MARFLDQTLFAELAEKAATNPVAGTTITSTRWKNPAIAWRWACNLAPMYRRIGT